MTQSKFTLEQLFISKQEAFDLLFFAIKREIELQQKVHKEFLKHNDFIEPNEVFDINTCVLNNFLEQLKEQDAKTFLVSEFIYYQK